MWLTEYIVSMILKLKNEMNDSNSYFVEIIQFS